MADDDDNDDLMSALTGKVDKPVWLFVALAVAVAALWTLSGLPNAPPFNEAYDPPSAANRYAGMLGYSLVPAVITWAALQILVLSRRSPFSKSLAILALLVMTTFLATAIFSR